MSEWESGTSSQGGEILNPNDLLPVIGIGLQWARAQKKFADAWYLGIVAGASVGFYALGHPVDAFAQRWDYVVAGCWGSAQTILAMTQLVSSGSNVAVSIRGNAGPVPAGIPVTDSQGGGK
jgi:hypothetical protein